MGYEILSYLLRHPKAQDTVEGIVEWWLLEERIVRALADVKKALAELAAKELILVRKATGGRIYYRVNPEKLIPIRTMLKGQSRKPH